MHQVSGGAPVPAGSRRGTLPEGAVAVDGLDAAPVKKVPKALKKPAVLDQKVAKETAVAKAAPVPKKKAVAGKKGGAKKASAGDLFGPAGQKNPVRVPADVMASLREAYETSHGGLSSKIRNAGSDENHVYINGDIVGPDGKNAGVFTRIIERDKSGELAAKHELLLVDREFQGQGFAREFNNKAIDWYRSQDFAEVRFAGQCGYWGVCVGAGRV